MARSSPIWQLVPLFITLLILGSIAFVIYHIYLSFTKMSEHATERMGKKNVVFTKDGMKVGVKDIQNEKYVDKTQSYVVKAWNLGVQENNAAAKRK